MNIPEQAVEATAKIVSEQMRSLTRSDYHGSSTEVAYTKAAARYALQAVAPLIAAQALREAAKEYPGEPDGLTSNGHVRWFLGGMADGMEAPNV